MNVFRKDRNKFGGGVFIAVHVSIKCELSWISDLNESICVKIFHPITSKCLYIIAVYRPPNSNFSVLNELFDRTNTDQYANHDFIIGGDLNLPQVDWNGSIDTGGVSQQCVNKLITEAGFQQVVKNNTRQNNILDVFLLRPTDLCTSIDVVNGISDHKAVIMQICFGISSKVLKPIPRKIWKYNIVNVTTFKQHLDAKFVAWSNQNFENCSPNFIINQLWNSFKEIIFTARDISVPYRMIKTNSDPVYYTKSIKSLKRKLRRLNRKKFKSPYVKQKIRLTRSKLIHEKNIAYNMYIKNLISNSNSDKNRTNFYTHIKNLKKDSHSIPELISDEGIISEPNLVVNNFNTYFASVFNAPTAIPEVKISKNVELFKFNIFDILAKVKKLKNKKACGPDFICAEMLKIGGFSVCKYLEVLFNISMKNSCLPSDWKCAHVTPIFKSGSKKLASNYRPISLTSIVCKLFEKLLIDYLLSQLDHWFSPFQHGFRKGYSCESQLLSFSNELSSNCLLNKLQTDCIIIDYQKAFDAISHSTLIQKFNDLNIDSKVTKWICEYLSNRIQYVKMFDHISSSLPVTSGVPQGSALGPILFLIYINDLATALNCRIRLFADDAIIYILIRCIEDCEILQRNLLLLSQWSSSNSMRIHDNKCKCISFSLSKNPIIFDYNLDNVIIPRVQHVKYLGLTFSCDLSWNEHINTIVSKASRNLHFVMRNLKFASPEVKNMAYKSLVLPSLEYACSVWDPYHNYLIKKLESVQRKAARYVCMRHNYRDSVTEMLNELRWSSLENRRKCFRIVAMYKIYCRYTAYLELSENISPPHYISRNDHKFKIACISVSTDREKYSFLARTINDWNSLNQNVFDPFPISSYSFHSVIFNSM